MKISKIVRRMSIVGAMGLVGACGTPTASPDGAADATLRFDASAFEARTITVDGKAMAIRAYENVAYVARPVDAAVQVMNIYVPEPYFAGGSVEGFTAQTAPIFLPNYVGGYMPSGPGRLDGKGMPGPSNQPNAITQALAKGYVVATPGARGRTSKDAQGNHTGKAPAAIVDLKAAVRYLHYNDARMPGDANKIIANGTSAGGALSALLGASGQSAGYEEQLKALGAAPAPDNIFAVSAYAPIANLEHADAAHEWLLGSVHQYKKIDVTMLDYKVQRKTVAGTLAAAQIKVSDALKALFPAYVNSLKLRGPKGDLLTLDADGNGPFKEHLKAQLVAAAQTALNEGQNLSAYPWLQIEGKQVRGIDFDAYLIHLGRMKLPPAFDALDLSSGENQLFGTAQIDKSHFTDFSAAHSQVPNAPLTDARTVGLMNPMQHIADCAAGTARHWRIRHGTKDNDTSLAIPALLALALQNQGANVDFALVWERPHSGDYDLGELFAWVKQVSTATGAPAWTRACRRSSAQQGLAADVA